MKKLLVILLLGFISVKGYAATKYALMAAAKPAGDTSFCYGTAGSGAYTDTWTLCTAASGTGGVIVTYQWMIDGHNITGATGTFSASPTAVTTYTLSAIPSLDTLHTGTHQLFVRYSWSSGPSACHTSPLYSDSLTITIHALPAIVASPSAVSYCPGAGGVSLTATGGTTYTWSPADGLSATTGASVSAAPATPTTYTVTGGSAGCMNTATATVNFAAPFYVTATATPSVVCVGGSSVLNTVVNNTSYNTVASIPYTAYVPVAPVVMDFSADPNDGWNNIPLPFTFYMYGTMYNSVNVNVNGFINFGVSDTAVWNSFTLPTEAAPSQMIALFLHDLDLTFYGSITYETIGTAPNRAFVISYNNVPDADYSSPDNTGQIIIYESTNNIDLVIADCNEPGDATGDYTTTTGVQNADGTQGAGAPGRNGINFVATNEAWRFTGIPTDGYSYSWSTGDAAATATVSVSSSTGYAVSVTEASSGCSVAASVSVVVTPLPSIAGITTSDNSLCAGGTLVLTATGISEGSGGAVYTWSGPGMATATTDTVVSPLLAPTATGTYSVSVTCYGSGCTSAVTTSSVVTVFAQPSVSVWASPTFVCVGHTMTLTATTAGGTGTAAYTWSGPAIAGTAGPFSSPAYTVVSTAGTPAGEYSVSVTYAGTGCNTAVGHSFTVTTASQQWAGTYSSDWNTADNWTCGTVPLATDNVVVPGGTTFAPTIGPGSGFANELTISGTTITLYAGTVLTVNGNLHNDGTIGGAGILYMNGSTAQAINGNSVINNLTIDNAAGVSVNTVGDTLSIAGTLLVNSGTLTTNNRLMLLSGDTGTARIGAITGGAISGNVTVQQYIEGGRRAYRFWAHPFSNAIPLSQVENYIDITGIGGSINGFTTTSSNAPSAYWYNTLYSNSGEGFDPGWRAFTSTSAVTDSNQLHPYQGMRLFMRGAKGEGLTGATYTADPVTIRMWGSVNTGSITIPMVKGTGTDQDYNLVGNPYPSPVDVGAVIANASAAGQVTGAAFWIWNPQIGTSGQFVTKLIGGSYYMGANESFEVRATANGDTLGFAESNKVNTISDVLLRSAGNDLLQLSVYDTAYHLWDMLYVRFDSAATDNEDNKYDGQKPQSPASLNFYSISADNKKLSLDTRPYADGKVMPLGITSSYAQEFIIKADHIAIPVGGQLYLHDKYLQQYTLLEEGTEYKFTITKDSLSQGNSRFELRMGEPEVAGIQQAQPIKVLMTPNPATNEVTINYNNSAMEATTISVTDVAGVTVISKDLGIQQQGSTTINLDRLAAGIYMVTVTSGNNKEVARLVKE